MKEYGIVFVHHRADATTRNNLAAIRQHNPEAVVVPVSQWGPVLPGGVDSKGLYDGAWRAYWPGALSRGVRGIFKRMLQGPHRSYYWRNADLPLLQWYTHHGAGLAKRWVLLEWDVFCNIPLPEFYGAVWDADLAATSVHTPSSDPDWGWFSAEELAKVPAHYERYVTGLSPLAGMFASDLALRNIASRVRDDASVRNVFCELRVPTVAQALGIEAVEISDLAKETLRGNPHFDVASISKPSVWHKVKEHNPAWEVAL